MTPSRQSHLAWRHPVYIVDNDLMVCDSLRFLLSTLGVDGRVFKSGSEFIAASASLPPGCLLLDISMPGEDGFAVLRRIQEYPRRFGTIVISGSEDALDIKLAFALGASLWLEKPFTDVALIEAMRTACPKPT